MHGPGKATWPSLKGPWIWFRSSANEYSMKHDIYYLLSIIQVYREWPNWRVWLTNNDVHAGKNNCAAFEPSARIALPPNKVIEVICIKLHVDFNCIRACRLNFGKVIWVLNASMDKLANGKRTSGLLMFHTISFSEEK